MSTPARAVGLSDDLIERETRRIGAELADAFPSAARHPVRALDARAMELASSDRELRAALFRFVDVVPACRTLHDRSRRRCVSPIPRPDAPPSAPPQPAASSTWRTASSSARPRPPPSAY